MEDAELVACLGGVTGGGDAKALLNEIAGEQRAETGIIVDDKDVGFLIGRGAHRRSRVMSAWSRRGAGLAVHDPAHDPAEAVNGGGAGFAVGGGEDLTLTLEEAALECRAADGEGEMALPGVAGAAGLGDVVLFDQGGEDAGEALLGDAEDGEEVADGNAGATADEVDGTVMGAAEVEIVEDAVGGGGEIAVGEEEQILGLPHLLLAKEEVAGVWRLLGVEPIHAATAVCRTRSRYAAGIGQSC